ncbi:DUF881 domain-containing protein [Leekyejoonella antrihumi]|uniref:DUF881 domain-containing protein n=1 Tax=Leekyejoonella antrihumi TaxID=1660198 RepID=A0A563E3K2_9MICO|nr:DUF881 domain-containing protein [Leekyejoonella antrihumi]TWP36802.1 DUF881 domain-containing protein [Leekyejoonella antrihumi]
MIAPQSSQEGEEPPVRPAEGTSAEPGRSGWARLLRMGRPRATRANVFATLLALALGFAMVTQVHENLASGLENLSQGDLIALLDGVNQQSLHLDQEKAKLTRTRASLQTSTGDKAALSAAQERKDVLGILAGTLPAQGPGIALTINDPKAVVQAANVLDAVEELRDAGAEAIQIAGVRVVADTWFGVNGDNALVVDGQVVQSPYIILAIGSSHTMSTAMEIPGGVVDSLKQLGAHPSVASLKTVNIDALRAPTVPRYAQSDGSTP